jgi:hypothetical protein
MTPDETLGDWARAIRVELQRLGSPAGDDPAPAPGIELTTLWEGKRPLWPRDASAGSALAYQAYAYLLAHGHDAFWTWHAARDPADAPPWAFYFARDWGKEGMDACHFPLDKAEAVLRCLQALPAQVGAWQVWEALEALAPPEEER